MKRWTSILLAAVFWLASVPHESLGEDAIKPVELPRIVVTGDFGDAVPENIVKVLESTAEQLLKHTPARRFGTILVSPSHDVPISLYAKGTAGEY